MSDDEERDLDRTDLERVGLFIDGPYDTDVTMYRVTNFTEIMGRDETPMDDPLRLDGPFPILPGHKVKAATNDWTFAEEFLSINEDVPYEDPGFHRRQYIAEQKENILDGPWITSDAKCMNGSGTLYGTFMEADYEAFSPEEREKPEREEELINFLTSPGKKGTGYGYNDVCLNPYPEYMEDPLFDHLEAKREMREEHEAACLDRDVFKPPGPPQDYFDPNPWFDSNDPDGQEETYDFSRLKKDEVDEEKEKWIPANFTKKINGNKDVVSPLEKFPEYEEEEYQDPPINIFRQFKPDPEKPTWKPQFGNRTRQTRSILKQNITLRVNNTNFHMF